MPRRQPLPRLWLMTDERQGDALWEALARLPRGAGIVFRHYGLPPHQRRATFEAVRRIARRRRLILIVAGTGQGRADGCHGRRGRGLRTASAHDLREVRTAERQGAHLVFLSPVFPTRSHPGGTTLGPLRFGRIARQARIPVVALGGIDPGRARRLIGLHAYGWAGIDAWSAGKKPPLAGAG
jgi:thiamine-phosphate pyrophosphorylase